MKKSRGIIFCILFQNLIMIVTYPDKRKQATSKLKKISNRFALQLQQQLEVPLEEIEKAAPVLDRFLGRLFTGK